MSNADDKKKALALVLEKLDKTYGKGTVMTLGDSSVDNTIEVIPSGSLGLDEESLKSTVRNLQVKLL